MVSYRSFENSHRRQPPRPSHRNLRDQHWSNDHRSHSRPSHHQQSTHRSQAPWRRSGSSERATQRPHQPTIPPDYFGSTRKHFAVIKSLHHLMHAERECPKSLSRNLQDFFEGVRPAFLNDCNVFVELRNKWCGELQAALVSHYKEHLSLLEIGITSSALPPDIFERSLVLSSKWARRQLGKRLSDDVLDQALQLIRKWQPLSSEDVGRTHQPVTSEPQPGSPKPSSVEAFTQTGRTSLSSAGCDVDVASTGSSRQASTQTEDVTLPPGSDPPALAAELLSSPVDAPRMASSQLTSAQTEDVSLPSSREPSVGTVGPAAVAAPLADPDARLGRKRRRSIPDRTHQLDLFGAEAAPPPPARRRASSLTGGFCPRKEIVLFGDLNWADFKNPEVDVYTHPSGKLHHFKTLLSKSIAGNGSAKSFILCISSLDRCNTSITNTTALKCVRALVRKYFPSSRLTVFCCPVPSRKCEWLDCHKDSINALNDFVRSRFDFLNAPDDPVFTDHDTMHPDTRDACFDVVNGFLNDNL